MPISLVTASGNIGVPAMSRHPFDDPDPLRGPVACRDETLAAMRGAVRDDRGPGLISRSRPVGTLSLPERSWRFRTSRTLGRRAGPCNRLQ